MSATPDPADPERLLVHDAFVRGLARQLVRDPERAADAAQETWLAAVRRGPTGTDDGSVRAFLATVLRRLIGRQARTERREAARRQAAAHDGVVPSPAEILQREAQRAEVVRLVLALEPAQRDAVVLRFFEHLPPRAIAKRLGVPVETVRTRLKRALASLRSRLDDRPGGRAAWVALLAPFADGPVLHPWWPDAGTAAVSGGIGMSVQKLIVVGLVVAAVAAMWITFGPPAGTRAEAPAAHEPAVPAVAAAEPANDTSANASAPEQAAGERSVATAAASESGTLNVSVTFAADGTPAADAVVEVYRNDADALFERPRARTDAAGRVRFDGLRPGKVHATLHRGNTDWGDAVAIVAGGTVDAKLVVPAGMDVRGIVVDGNDRPIAGADVVVADWGGGNTIELTRTADDGTFAARQVATHCHIGARAAGFAASPLRQFTAGKGAAVDVRIVLDKTATELHGIVLDPHGVPVAGAVVRAGSTDQKNHALADGARAMGWRPEQTSTDAGGRFVLRHLPAGTVPFAVRGKGLAPWSQDVELVAGPPQRLVVTLAPGATLVGTVADAAGAPLRADVRVGEWEDLGRQHVRTGTDGTYRLDGLAAGVLHVVAESDEHDTAAADVTLSPGQSSTWSPRLDRGLTVKGRVVDADDRPVAKVMIEARLENERQGDHWWAHANTGDDGRFVLKNCPAGRTVQLEVRRKSTFSELKMGGIATGATDVVVRLPKDAWIHIRGSILDPDGKPLPNVAVSPWLTAGGSSPAETADPATGRVQLGPYPPGSYSLRLAAPGFPPIVLSRDVAGDETWDFGELRFERGGDVAISLVAADDTMLAGIRASVQAARAGEHANDVAIENGQGRLGPLRAGEYTLRVHGPGAVPAAMPFTIAAGRETRLDVPLHAGVPVTVLVAAPPGVDGWFAIEVLGAGDDVVTTWSSGRGMREVEAKLRLDPGHYRAFASCGDSKGAAELDVVAGGSASVRVELRAK